MKITYYGTAAAEGIPAMFCSCPVCERARKAGGRNIRSRSQALIDEELLIDFPADTYFHCIAYGLELRNIKSCLITHGHDDHIYPYDFLYRAEPYAHFPDGGKEKKPLDIYSSKHSGKEFRERMAGEMIYERDKNALSYHELKKYQSYDIQGYEVIPLGANHAPQLDSLIYIIKKDGKAVLYAHDTGCFLPEAWDFIENSGIKFDLVSLDCTSVKKDTSVYHMGLNQCLSVRERLERKNTHEKTVFVLNHFSHNGLANYDDLVPDAERLGFIVSYDGMSVEF